MKHTLRPRLAVLRPRRSLRTVFALSFAALTALVTLLVGFLSYDAAARMVRVDRDHVFHGVLGDLRHQVRQQRLAPHDHVSSDPDHDGPRGDLTRLIRTDVQVLGHGGRIAGPGTPALPVRAADRRAADTARAGRTTTYRAVIAGKRYRVAGVALGGGRGAVQVARQFSDTEDLLAALQQRTMLLTGIVITASGVTGWWLAWRTTRRLVRLTGVAEGVAASGLLDVAVPAAGQDEVSLLGRAFDDMLGRLADSEEVQRRLVQDAGHELRTPLTSLTSLRANAAMLDRIDALPPSAKAGLIADMQGETRELTDPVNELVDLAAGQRDGEEPVAVPLAGLVGKAAVLARRRTGREITVRADGTVVRARPAAVHRAVTNLLENAAKFDSAGTEPIEAVVSGPRVEVHHRGPGVAGSDLPRIFDRFYRAEAARSLPGSGLGLAIVRAVASAHGGIAYARNRPGGGAVIGFTLGTRLPAQAAAPERAGQGV